MNKKALSSIIHFEELSDQEKNLVSDEIIRNNKLKISVPAFVRKASNGFLILRKNGEIEKFVSVGLKEVGVKLKRAIISNRGSIKVSQRWVAPTKLFFARLERDELFERGWATNLTGIPGSLKSLSDEFDRHLKSLGKDRSHTFCTVVSTNKAGNSSAIESGYTRIGEFDSPFSDHSLNLFIWTNAK